MKSLYEDHDVIAVAKPAGLAVIPGRDETPAQALRGVLEQERGERLWVVHRLDRDTSGVVLFARNETAHRRLSMAFEAREVDKLYWAWTRGVPSPEAGDIDVPMHTARKGRMRPALPGEEGALESRTAYRVLQQRQSSVGSIARVEARPRTGRQHQIRVHLRAAGAPLLVDPLYGRCESVAAGELGEGAPAVGRLTLHAAEITFRSGEGRAVTVRAPLPEDLAALDDWLYAPGS
jgi:tRNA pseudouridine32 synthase/23S rRNA pseudouridine746 synthase